MERFFPTMYSKPKTIRSFLLLNMGVWVFIMVPTLMPFLGLGLWDQWEISAWLEIGYHVFNGIILLFLIFGYLKDETFMVTTGVRFYLKHILLTIGLIVVVVIAWVETLYLFGFSLPAMLENLPVTEMFVSHTPLFLLDLKPILGTIVLSIFTPISVCALFYYPCFAPLCNIKPWLGYLGAAVITLIPPIVEIMWRGNTAFVLIGYLTRLPIHLLACWSYQKTDNAWTPLLSLAGSNLILSGLLQIYLHR